MDLVNNLRFLGNYPKMQLAGVGFDAYSRCSDGSCSGDCVGGCDGTPRGDYGSPCSDGSCSGDCVGGCLGTPAGGW